MLCTFTRAASGNMRSRLEQLLGRSHNVWCHTIDALALTQLEEFGPVPGVAQVSELSVSEYGLNFLRGLDSAKGKQYLASVQYLLVDEVQDLDTVQYELVLKHVAAGVRVMAVGDAAQTLYGFRGADIRLLDRLRSAVPTMHTYHLRGNFRSHAQLVQLANTVIDKKMKAVGKGCRTPGPLPIVE